MVVLFLHGKEGSPGGTKPTYLARHGLTVINPLLPDDDFAEAVRIAQTEFDRHKPTVVVGSSRGGAVAMNIASGNTPLVLLCPAWKKWGELKTVKQNTIVLHSKSDAVIPFSDSEELIANSNLSGQMLLAVGVDHRLSTDEPLAFMLDAVRMLGADASEIPAKYDARVTPDDRALLDAIRRELAREDLTPEQRSELIEEGHCIANGYIWEEMFRDESDAGPPTVKSTEP